MYRSQYKFLKKYHNRWWNMGLWLRPQNQAAAITMELPFQITSRKKRHSKYKAKPKLHFSLWLQEYCTQKGPAHGQLLTAFLFHACQKWEPRERQFSVEHSIPEVRQPPTH
jgi:hypothetical protein